jgi:hypothetical protein
VAAKKEDQNRVGLHYLAHLEYFAREGFTKQSPEDRAESNVLTGVAISSLKLRDNFDSDFGILKQDTQR